MELTAIFPSFAQTAGPIAATALWQGGALAAGLAICLKLVPRIGAADRFRAWAAGFSALIALPFLPLLLAALHADSGNANYAFAAPQSRAWLDLDPRWAFVIAAAWIAASVWRVADLAIHSFKLRQVWKEALPVAEPVAGYEICSTPTLDRPCVIGFFRPRILIPDWLLARMTAYELEQVVLHEAEHLRRWDDWTNLAQKLALVLFPLNPALAWMERQLCHEREIACDDAVVRATGKPRAYAACLASLAERGLQRSLERRREALALGAWRKRPELVGRVHRLLKYAPGLNPAAARALLAVVGSGLIFGAVEFARAPQLVEFAAPPVIAQSNTPDLVNPSATLPAGYKMVNAIAHMPAAPVRASVAIPVKHIARKPAVSSATADGNTMQMAADQKPDSQTTPQFIVLATWEQVVALNREGQIVADYDVTADQGPDENTNPAAAASQPSQGWAVTHLLLRVDPAKTGAAQDADPNSQPSSLPVRPTVIPLRDGWLVFQL